MEWKLVRLELASSWQYPRGSAGRSYSFRLPLTEDGLIDAPALEANPMRATVRRYWPNEPDVVGHLLHTPCGFSVRYEDGAAADGRSGGELDGDCDHQLVQFDKEAIHVGEHIFLTGPDGRQLRFRIASIQ